MKNITERLLIAWYALTKKHYAIYAYEHLKNNKVYGAQCFINDGTENENIFLEAITEYTTELIEENKSKTNHTHETNHSN